MKETCFGVLFLSSCISSSSSFMEQLTFLIHQINFFIHHHLGLFYYFQVAHYNKMFNFIFTYVVPLNPGPNPGKRMVSVKTGSWPLTLTKPNLSLLWMKVASWSTTDCMGKVIADKIVYLKLLALIHHIDQLVLSFDITHFQVCHSV